MLQIAIKLGGGEDRALPQENNFLMDDMEKKNQQSGQHGQNQSSQPGQGQHGSQSGHGQTENPSKKGNQGQNEKEPDDQNRDRQRRSA